MHALSAAQHADRPQQEPATILVADVNQADARALENLLRARGYVVRSVHTAQEAMSAIHAERPALALVAADLGDISGEEFNSALRVSRETRGVPVLLLQPQAAEGAAGGSGNLDFIRKPFQPAEVLVRVRTHLELAALRDKHKEQTRVLTLALQRLADASRPAEPEPTGLRDSRAQLEALIDRLPALVYRLRNDAAWTPEFISDGCLAVTGYAAGDLLHSRVVAFQDLVHPGDLPSLREQVGQCVSAGQPYEIAYRIRHRDGTERSVLERGRGVADADGGQPCRDGLVVDVTGAAEARRAAAAEISRLEATLVEALQALGSRLSG